MLEELLYFLKFDITFYLEDRFLQSYAPTLCVAVSFNWVILNLLIHAET